MKHVKGFSLIGLIILNLPLLSVQSNLEIFAKYSKLHSKIFSNEAETYERFQIFVENLDKIEKPYDVNELSPFMDLTHEEFKEKYLSATISSVSISNLEIYTSQLLNIPNSINYAEMGVVTPVKTQGTCGACWAFATVSVIETQTKLVNNILQPLSEQQLVDCDNANSDCDGGWVDLAFTYVKKIGGIMKGSEYPYIEKQGRCKFIPEDVVAKVKSFYALSQDEEEIRKVVAEKGTVAIILNAAPLQLYKKGDVVTGENCDPKNLNHAVVIVGFTDVIIKGISKPVWIVRNSWGEEFGNNGYFYILRNVGACGLNKKVFIGFVEPTYNQ